MKRKYSPSFIKKVRDLYKNKTMNELAEKHHYFLGRYLDDSSQGGIGVDYILSHSYEEILAIAKEIKAKRDLYGEWQEQVKDWK